MTQRNGHDFDGGHQCVRCNCGIAVAHLMPCNRPRPAADDFPGMLVLGDPCDGSVIPAGDPRVNNGVDGSIHRLRRAVAAFYGSDESEPAPDVLEARELELDAALRAWAQAGMPGGDR